MHLQIVSYNVYTALGLQLTKFINFESTQFKVSIEYRAVE